MTEPLNEKQKETTFKFYTLKETYRSLFWILISQLLNLRIVFYSEFKKNKILV